MTYRIHYRTHFGLKTPVFNEKAGKATYYKNHRIGLDLGEGLLGITREIQKQGRKVFPHIQCCEFSVPRRVMRQK